MASEVYFIPAKREEGDEVLAEKAEEVFLKTGLKEKLEKNSFVALKIHFGEEDNTGFINPAWLLRIIDQIRSKTSRAFLTDSNTLYIGKRSNSVDHLLLAKEHGFASEKLAIPVIIADGLIGRNNAEIEVNLPLVKKAKVASLFFDSDALLCLSHFTGHVLAGFGAAIKNLGMGCASRAGKLEQHSDVHPWVSLKKCTGCEVCVESCPVKAIVLEDDRAVIRQEKCIGCGECLVACKIGAIKFSWDEDAKRVQQKMSEYACSVMKHFRGKAGFVSFLLQITKDCDCMSKTSRPIVGDIGILSSVDPVAIDKASVDLVIGRSGRDVLRAGYDVDWSVQLKHGVKVGLGQMGYKLVELT